jgi:hypothetical protein
MQIAQRQSNACRTIPKGRKPGLNRSVSEAEQMAILANASG